MNTPKTPKPRWDDPSRAPMNSEAILALTGGSGRSNSDECLHDYRAMTRGRDGRHQCNWCGAVFVFKED